jgi:hypothetical protein
MSISILHPAVIDSLLPSTDLNTIIHDNKALGVIGLYSCLGGFLALPIGRMSDAVRLCKHRTHTHTHTHTHTAVSSSDSTYQCVFCTDQQVGRRPIALFAMAIDLVAYFCANMAAQPEHQPHWHGDLTSSFAPSVCGYACVAGLLDGELSKHNVKVHRASSNRPTSPAVVYC